MESYNQSLLLNKIFESGLILMNSVTLKKVLNIKNERTFHRIVDNFTKNNILKKIERNKYLFTSKGVTTFEIANFLYQPSYISLETALNYWGVLSQFPFEVTNISLKKTITKEFEGKIYKYNHLSSKYFGMFTKKNNSLIALPEKALFDQIYLASKGLKIINFDEYDLKHVNMKSFFDICKQLKAGKNIVNIAKKINQ